MDRERPHGFCIEKGSREGGSGDDGDRSCTGDSGTAERTRGEYERDVGGIGGTCREWGEEVGPQSPSAEEGCDNRAGKRLFCHGTAREIHVETGELDVAHNRYFTNLGAAFHNYEAQHFDPPVGERKVTFSKSKERNWNFPFRERNEKYDNSLGLLRYRKGMKLVNQADIIVP
jgi:hypothetical protein